MDNPELSDLHRALCFYIVIQLNFCHADGGKKPSFAYSANTNFLQNESFRRIEKISNRIKKVTILNRKAERVLEYLKNIPNVIIYCDPPYVSSYTSAYRHGQFDKNEIEKLLRQQRGKVAVSGYGDEWDCLGWDCFEYGVALTAFNSRIKNFQKRRTRTEKLWVNFKPEGRLF